MAELWENYIDDDDELDFGDEEDESDQETRFIKIMGKLMMDLTFLDIKELTKGIEYFVKKEKIEIERLRVKVREKR